MSTPSLLRQRLLRFVMLLAISLLAAMPSAKWDPSGPAVPNTRLRIVLVLDASGSMAGNDPQRLVRVASKMLADLTDERDHVTVMSFGSDVKTLYEGSGAAHPAIHSAIATLGRNESCTDYAAALEAAAAKLNGKPPEGERRVVLFLTDGRFEPVSPNGSCGRFETAKDDERKPILDRITRTTQRFNETGTRVFTIGLGNAPTRAAQSVAVLRQVAAGSSGRFLHAKGPRDVPPIFASIFGALVGAPVMQFTVDRNNPNLTFKVPKGTDRLHVVLVPDQTGDLDAVSLRRGNTPLTLEAPQIETPRSGYRLARLTTEASGDYTLSNPGKVPGSRRIDVLVIPDAGLSLRIEGIPDVLPEQDPLKGLVAVRTRAGAPVKLAPEYLQHVVFTVTMNERKLFDQAPTSNGEAGFSSKGSLQRGEYTIRASAKHGLGFLDVAPVSKTFKVEPRFSMDMKSSGIGFDGMAEELDEGSIPLTEPATLTLTAPDKLPIDVELSLQLPDDLAADVVLEPLSVVFGPDKPKQASFTLRWKDARAMRGVDRHYTGDIQLVPSADRAKLLVGTKQWSMPVDAHVRSWTLARYLREYKWQLIIGTLLLLLIIYIVGRVVAQKFPPKARIHYVEVGQQFESDSLVKRYAKHGAYRNARFKFPLGKKSRPLVWFKSTGAGFEVIPENNTVTVLDSAHPEGGEEKRKPFRGSWEQRYRLSDRYEVWLTRT